VALDVRELTLFVIDIAGDPFDVLQVAEGLYEAGHEDLFKETKALLSYPAPKMELVMTELRRLGEVAGYSFASKSEEEVAMTDTQRQVLGLMDLATKEAGEFSVDAIAEKLLLASVENLVEVLEQLTQRSLDLSPAKMGRIIDAVKDRGAVSEGRGRSGEGRRPAFKMTKFGFGFLRAKGGADEEFRWPAHASDSSNDAQKPKSLFGPSCKTY
jgi:hypothetical protein